MAIRLPIIAFLLMLTGCHPELGDPTTVETLPTWRRYTTTNSPLPHSQINALAIGPHDVVWIGTADGLARYQDSHWTIFTTSNSALPSNVVQALTVQPDGTVWVGTNQGLAKYDGTNWVAFTEKNSSLPERAILSLTHDPVHQLTWVGTTKGIVSIDTAQQWTLFDELAGELVLSMTPDHTGDLWLGTHEPTSFRGRIRRFAKGQWKTYQLDRMGFESAFPYAMGVDRNNRIVALLAGTVVNTALQLTADSWSELSKPAGVYGLRALAIRGEEVWVGGKVLLRLGLAGALPLDIPDNDDGVLSMAVDSTGKLWLGSVGGGIWVYQP